MKTIAIILPVNNPDMLDQQALQPYQSAEYRFKLYYVDTHLRELTNVIEAATVLSLVLQKIQQAEQEGASAVIVYAFGDLGIKEAKGFTSIPVMGLGKSAIHMASMLCRNRYTVIPSMIGHYGFIEEMIFEEGLGRKFVPASRGVEINPAQLKGNPAVLNKLIEVASYEIEQNGVDTFTLGCGCFVNVAKPMAEALSTKYHRAITVIDPVETPFAVVKTLV
jgi:Asp/Glu/hydantoin racemase